MYPILSNTIIASTSKFLPPAMLLIVGN